MVIVMTECGIAGADLQQFADVLVSLLTWSGLMFVGLGYLMADPLCVLRLCIRVRRLVANTKGGE